MWEGAGNQAREMSALRVGDSGDVAVTVRWQTRTVGRRIGGRSGLRWRGLEYYCCTPNILANCTGHVGQ